jgi:hypothetical protein
LLDGREGNETIDELGDDKPCLLERLSAGEVGQRQDVVVIVPILAGA